MFIKGFDKDLKCRNFQFEIGQTYDTCAKDDELKLCTNTVFHFCRSLRQVHIFYNCNEDNRYCEIEVLGKLIEERDKCGSNKVKIVREITGDELNQLKGLERENKGLFNTGYGNNGYENTGDGNTGYGNTGYDNNGNKNTGFRNSGNGNTGTFNTCNYSNGFFNTKEPTVNIFNVDSGMTASEFYKSKYYYALMSSPFILTEWVDDELKEYTYKEACANWWAKMTDKNKEIIKSIPNFNAEIFKEITGIEV